MYVYGECLFLCRWECLCKGCDGCSVWEEVLCWIDHVWSSKECACCACDHSGLLNVPFIGFVYVFCMSEVISAFKSLRAGSQVLTLLVLFLCVILHTMWSGKSLQLLLVGMVV